MPAEPTCTPFCRRRCGKELTPGSGNFFVIRAEAIDDPILPDISADDLSSKLIPQVAETNATPIVGEALRSATLLRDNRRTGCQRGIRAWSFGHATKYRA